MKNEEDFYSEKGRIRPEPVTTDADTIRRMFPPMNNHSTAEQTLLAVVEQKLSDGFSRIERMLSLKEKRILSVSEAASLLNVKPLTVRRWLEDGKLKGTKSGEHKQAKWFVKKVDIERFLDAYVNQT